MEAQPGRGAGRAPGLGAEMAREWLPRAIQEPQAEGQWKN